MVNDDPSTLVILHFFSACSDYDVIDGIMKCEEDAGIFGCVEDAGIGCVPELEVEGRHLDKSFVTSFLQNLLES